MLRVVGSVANRKSCLYKGVLRARRSEEELADKRNWTPIKEEQSVAVGHEEFAWRH
jgi:hypothetical protein